MVLLKLYKTTFFKFKIVEINLGLKIATPIYYGFYNMNVQAQRRRGHGPQIHHAQRMTMSQTNQRMYVHYNYNKRESDCIIAIRNVIE
jgi:competence protein ComGF